MRTQLRLILVLLLLAPGVVSAKIYKWVLADGSIKYSDQPQEKGAKALQLPALQTYSPPPTPSPEEGGEEDSAAVADTGYDSVEVVSPEAGAALRDNGGGIINVKLAIEPSLHDGHIVEIMIDGKAIGSGRATSASVSNLDRGTHSISAVIKDADGKIVFSANAVTFSLQRTSKLQPGRAPKPATQSRARGR